MLTQLGYFDPSAFTEDLSGNLPHWRLNDVIYFVTFRLADSLPQDKLHWWNAERQQWLAKHPEPRSPELIAEYHKLFTKRFHDWLDAGNGECILAWTDINQLVSTALRHFHGTRYQLGESVVMPNHVHALVAPSNHHELSEIEHSWKSFTAHEINKILKRRGPVWQKESFDHILRSPAQLGKVEQYIRDNPKAVFSK